MQFIYPKIHLAEAAERVQKLKEDIKISKKKSGDFQKKTDGQTKQTTLYALTGGENTASSTLHKCQQPTQGRR